VANPTRSTMRLNNHRVGIATRNSGARSTNKPQLDFSAQDKLDQQLQQQQQPQRPFIDPPAPDALATSISAPAQKQPSLNFPIDADNDDVLLGIDLKDLNLELEAAEASAPAATAGNQGFALSEDTETELEQVKISRSENFLSSSPQRKGSLSLSKGRRTRSAYPSYGKWPQQLEMYAEHFVSGRVGMKNTADIMKKMTPNYSLDANSNGAKYLMQLSRLPRDCGVRALKEFLPDVEVWSVHLVVDEQTAVVRFNDEEQLKSALEDVRTKWNPLRIDDSQYLQFGDGEVLWQYQDSNRWIACHPAMGKLIESMPPGSFQLIRHESRQYFIEKYNETMGRQTNYRSGTQRPIRSVKIQVWAQHGDEDENENEEEEEAEVKHDDAMMVWMGLPKSTHSSVPKEVESIHSKEGSESNGDGNEDEKEGHSTGENQTEKNEKNKKSEIVLDRNEYDHWKLLTVDDDEWEIMVTECQMEDEDKEKMSAVWRWVEEDGNEDKDDSALDDLEEVEDLYVILDAEDAEEVFRTGTFGGNGSAKRANITVSQSLERAFELFDGDCDADGNVKVFACTVYLDEEQKEQLEDDENCNVTEVERIALNLCCSINMDLLKEAMAMAM